VRAFLLILGLSLATPAAAAGPIVVELYTSQACESCRRANAVVAGLAARPDVLPLTFPVDYWDYIGWTDTLARPEFSDRQRERTRTLGIRGLQTPLAVVDGVAHASGLERGRLSALIRSRAAAARSRPTARFTARGSRVLVSAGSPASAEVWLVRYDPRLVQVPVTDGPNKGRRVPHRNVVRQLVRIGDWTGRAQSYALPASAPDELRSAVLVQSVDTGRVLAAAVQG
jgi:hypothetical protein